MPKKSSKEIPIVVEEKQEIDATVHQSKKHISGAVKAVIIPQIVVEEEK